MEEVNTYLKTSNVTFLYVAKDRQHNQAVELKNI